MYNVDYAANCELTLTIQLTRNMVYTADSIIRVLTLLLRSTGRAQE